MPPVLLLEDFDLVSQTKNLLTTLPEYSQDQFFSPEVQHIIIDQLKLDSNSWSGLVDGIWRHLGESGYVVIRGLPFDENNRLSVGLACLLGKPVRHNSKIPSVVREIRPRPETGTVPFENLPHTDSPHWIHPNDVITLQCKREDQSMKVYSRIAPVWEVAGWIKEHNPSLSPRLFKKHYPFILIPDDGEGGLQMQPVLSRVHEGGKERLHVRFCYPDSANCVADFDLDSECLNDLDLVLKAANEVSDQHRFLFYEGDWLIFDNLRTFHSKTDTSRNTERVLKKMKLQVDRARLYR